MKRTMTWIISVISLASLLVLAWGPVTRGGAARAQNDALERARAFHCTNGTVSGKYTYHLTGSLAGVGPVALIGTLTLTPDGSLTGQHAAISLNGQIVHDLPYSGTFSITPGCVATGSFTDATGLRVTAKFVAMEQGRELHVMNTDAGNVLSGVVKRID